MEIIGPVGRGVLPDLLARSDPFTIMALCRTIWHAAWPVVLWEQVGLGVQTCGSGVRLVQLITGVLLLPVNSVNLVDSSIIEFTTWIVNPTKRAPYLNGWVKHSTVCGVFWRCESDLLVKIWIPGPPAFLPWIPIYETPPIPYRPGAPDFNYGVPGIGIVPGHGPGVQIGQAICLFVLGFLVLHFLISEGLSLSP